MIKDRILGITQDPVSPPVVALFPPRTIVYPFIVARINPLLPKARFLIFSFLYFPTNFLAGSSQSKPSFFTRVVNKVVPCVTPTDDPSPIDQPRDNQNGEIETIEAKTPEASSQPDNSPAVASQQQDTSRAFVDDPMAPAEVVVPPAAQLLPLEETDGVTSGAVQPPGSTGEPIARIPTNESSDYPDSMMDEEIAMLDEQEEEERLMRNGGNGIPIGPVSLLPLRGFVYAKLAIQDGLPRPLLPPVAPQHAGRKCLVLDLDETLVHSSFKVLFLTFGFLSSRPIHSLPSPS